MIDIKSALKNPDVAQKFVAQFTDAYLTPAFGAKSKTEIDLLFLTCLFESKALSPTESIFDIARALNITPARVKTLIFNWQLRSTATNFDFKEALIEALGNTHFAKDGDYLIFGIESPLLREEIIAQLKKKKIFPDRSFSREIIRIRIELFIIFIEAFVDEKTKRDIEQKLVQDKQFPDKSMSGLIKGMFKKMGNKVADKTGGAVAESVVDHLSESLEEAGELLKNFLTSALKGDSKSAVKSAQV